MRDEEKKKEELPNKSFTPVSNKKQVRIQMRPGREAHGVNVDMNGYAYVDAETAARLVEINYAIMAEEK